MPTVILLVVGLVAIVLLLALIVRLLVDILRKQSVNNSPAMVAQISNAINAAIDGALDSAVMRLDAAVTNHVQVGAILAIVAQIEAGGPDTVELLKQYPETVRAATWLYTIDSLGADLKAETNKLSHAHASWGANDTTSKAIQSSVDAIRAKLDAAIAASGQRGLRAV